MKRFFKAPLFWLIWSAASLTVLWLGGSGDFLLILAGFATGLWFETCMRDGWLT